MTASSSIAANLACVLALLREQPDARDEQASAFQLLLAALSEKGLDLRVTGLGLRINDGTVAEGVPGSIDLRRQLLAHGIGEIRAPATVSPALFLRLLRTLAEPPGRYRSLTDLITHLEAPDDALFIAPPAPEGAEAAGDWSVYEPIGAEEPAKEAVALSRFRSVRSDHGDELDKVLSAIIADPGARSVPDRLNEAVALADAAALRGDWDEVVHAAATLVGCEGKAGNAALGRAYPIALRRMLPRSVLEHAAQLVTGPNRAAVLPVLQRMGADGTEVLLGLLASASTIEKRRAYYGALRQMTAGTELLVNMLTHDDWFVVRNVADLCGELRIESAVPRLTRHLVHEDERVRRAVASALTKIGTPSTIEPLRQALRDPAAAVRLQAVQGLDGRKSRALAMTLAVLVDDEKNPDVASEMLLALGRIGSAEAVQALVRATAPNRRIFGRKSVATRLAAIQGLQTAGGAPATTALQALLQDPEGEVRTAAQKALAQLNA
ncbi:MAG: HEAT repeat domain-containing protein [Gemmatimonadales bacterium]|nr:HEAT repeat domain-containing protein [Gemmatimonadales bacterium]